MTNRGIAALACKILGIYIIVQGINVFTNVISSLGVTELEQKVNHLDMIYAGGYVLFGIILILLANKLAALMFKQENEAKEEASLGLDDIQQVAFSVLGLFLWGALCPS